MITKPKSSVQPGKQRDRFFNASLHTRRKYLAAPLTKELREKHGRRSISIRTGDKVKVVRGQYSGTSGKVERTDAVNMRIFVTGIEVTKRNGSKTLYPIHPSNVIITDLLLSDKKRLKTASGTKGAKQAKQTTQPQAEKKPAPQQKPAAQAPQEKKPVENKPAEKK